VDQTDDRVGDDGGIAMIEPLCVRLAIGMVIVIGGGGLLHRATDGTNVEGIAILFGPGAQALLSEGWRANEGSAEYA
jgi:hypothetical protein